jgi:hypothetical protein
LKFYGDLDSDISVATTHTGSVVQTQFSKNVWGACSKHFVVWLWILCFSRAKVMFALVLFNQQVFTPEEGHEIADFKFAVILEETRFRRLRNYCSCAIHSFAHIVSQNIPTFPFLVARSLMTSIFSQVISFAQ